MVLLHSEREKLQQGDRIPQFTLRNIDGNQISNNDEQFKGKALAVIFICNHCPFVKPKLAEIATLQNEFKEKGIEVININANDAIQYPEDDFEHMNEVAQKHGLNYYLYDEEQNVAKDFGAVCTPDPFLFDKEHKLIYHGRINNAMNPSDEATEHDLKQAMQLIVEGKKPAEWFKPSMGCSIKWKHEE